MFKFIKDFFGGWILVPVEDIGSSFIVLILLCVVGGSFLELVGPIIIIPAFFAFIAPILLGTLCDKFSISCYWLDILHCFAIQRLIDLVASNAIYENPKNLGLINMILLFMILLIACGELVFISGDDGFPIFFVIVCTNLIYYFSTAIYRIPYIETIVIISFAIQIVMAVISQLIIIHDNKKR